MSKGKKRISLGGKVAIIIAAVVVVGGVAAWAIVNDLLGRFGKIDNVPSNTPVNIAPEIDENNGGEVIDDKSASDRINIDDIELMTDDDVINILCIGSDARTPGERDRSDSMIICSLNRKTGEIKLVSLMRDMYVKISGHGSNRLNAAYAFGGMPLLDETIEKNFGVKINGNVAVNFESFVEAISNIGNLDIELTAAEARYLNTDDMFKDYHWDLKEGVNSMNPEQLLAYSRIRHVGRSDWERTDRQRRVIMTAFAKVKDMSIMEALSLAKKIFPCIATDMDNGMLINLITVAFGKKPQIVANERIPLDGTYGYAMIDGKMSVMLPDLKKNSEALHDILYGATETADAQSNTVQNK
ncbi:MAG: LCP family protein [Firmicutes bacterium]|nr:LCP family protein [Bacillota bacterium]